MNATYECTMLLLVDDVVCLSGLHTCGDLATTMIRVFINLPCAKILSSIGCCYMKLTTHSAESM